MCGIAGVIGARDPDRARAEVERIIARLTHRGPDGVRIEAVGPHVLAHARLSIIDLEGGWQPLHGAGATVIGNGEIYNYVELTEAFGLKDALATGSDFEPLLHLYGREGEKAFARLRGMYGLCLIGGDGRVFLARDPFGIKPLHVAPFDGGIAFASEPGALPGQRGEEPGALIEDLLALGYRTGAAPFGVIALDPGEVAEVRDGALVRHVGVLPRTPTITPPPASEEAALARFDQVMEDSVRVHQRSDVPYGLFLSGGVDSSIIAALMARLNARPVTAFTCGFDLPEAADERAHAEALARALDLDWREVEFGEEDFWRLAPRVAAHLDDPTTDFACLPTLKLAEAAKGTLTVVLSGEGGDELFAGYGRYRRALRPRWLGGRPAEPQVDAPYLADGGQGALARWRAAGANTEKGLLRKAQLADQKTWLANDLLTKLDRMLMAEGLEGRTPFLDRDVADFAASLPDALRVRGRMGKWLLRRWLERHCPQARPFARKQGFTVPVAGWIAPRAGDLARTVPRSPVFSGVADPDKVRRAFLADEGASSRWPLLFAALWWAIHHEGARPDEALQTLLAP
jgi:asparagine synthase (glutamine-hydrolysing)